jgi:membrane fusion protein, multidrug efflux system
MKRWMKWALVLVVLAVLAGLVARAVKQRKQVAAAAAVSASAPAAMELGSADAFVARMQELTRTLAISGGLKAANSAVVKAKIASEIKSLGVREGDTVKAGQVIGQLDTTEFAWRLKQAEQTAASARAQLDIAKRTLDNNRALVAQGFISPTGLETSVSTEAGAQANYQSAMAAVELARKAQADSVLVSPINGIVSQRMVQPGERVGIDAKVVEIVDLAKIELEAAVTPEDVGVVQIGQTARLRVDGLSEPVFAKVVRINPSTQAGTRSVMVYLALQPQPQLRQGLFARGNIELQRKTALAAPVSAVRVDQSRPYVLAVEAGKVAQRNVELGARGDATFDGHVESAVELSSGVSEGAVLLRGTAGTLRDGTPVKLLMPKPPAASASASAAVATAR